YQMWYTGQDGITYRIGYATSDDGITWTKHASNPVVDLGTAGSWESSHVHSPSVVFNGSDYQMWYTASDGANSRIGYATSPDGVTWTKHASNPVLDIGTNGQWDDVHAFSPSVILNGTDYQMWYTGDDGSIYRIGYATSSDGTSWSKYASNPVLNNGNWGAWDYNRTAAPSVLKCGANYYMWYSGQGTATNYQLGYASSTNGTAWTKDPGNPVLGFGSDGSWDQFLLTAPSVTFNGSEFQIWYGGYDGSNNARIGQATTN
ncbi:hypothetical protein KA005_51935, partial [bacterium]|nr:hypothetical protein [bacterium]